MNAPHSIAPESETKADHDHEVHDWRMSRQEVLIVAVVLALVALWAGAVVLWGVPGLYLPAVALVPVVWLTLLAISRT
ncbi:MAG: hypothetical protein K8F31_12050 [Roseovarius sp.]|uniref:hypothetical protein n=1 Tax=Roseovarius amoyensis TaxID=2211448 RepID=UPI000DBE590C|nr:hypothetical protein [Roseovarius amoyensis]MBZ0124604.1 hypothetical protein [Roseovarius sp.]